MTARAGEGKDRIGMARTHAMDEKEGEMQRQCQGLQEESTRNKQEMQGLEGKASSTSSDGPAGTWQAQIHGKTSATRVSLCLNVQYFLTLPLAPRNHSTSPGSQLSTRLHPSRNRLIGWRAQVAHLHCKVALGLTPAVLSGDFGALLSPPQVPPKQTAFGRTVSYQDAYHFPVLSCFLSSSHSLDTS